MSSVWMMTIIAMIMKMMMNESTREPIHKRLHFEIHAFCQLEETDTKKNHYRYFT